MIEIDPDKCPQDHPCPIIRLCPKKAVSQTGNGLPRIDHSVCIECGLCIAHCPKRAFLEK
jgi:ferredoxin